jgi:hypothetical protein
MRSRRGEGTPVPTLRDLDDGLAPSDADEGFRLGLIISSLKSPTRRIPIVPVVVAAVAFAVVVVGFSVGVMVLVERL